MLQVSKAEIKAVETLGTWTKDRPVIGHGSEQERDWSMLG